MSVAIEEQLEEPRHCKFISLGCAWVVCPHILWGHFHRSCSVVYYSRCLKTLWFTPAGDAVGRTGRWSRFSNLSLFPTCLNSKVMTITASKTTVLFRPSVFYLFSKHPSQAVLFHFTKSSFLYCCQVFARIKGQVCLDVWLYILGKTNSEPGCWYTAPTVAEPSFGKHVL